MKLAIIGAKGTYNAEYFFVKAFKNLGVDVTFIDQYEGVNKKTLVRLITSRVKLTRFLLNNLKINKSNITGSFDAVLVFKGELLTERTLERLSKDYALYLFYPDTYRFLPILKGRLWFFNGVITTSPKRDFYYKLGAKNVYTINWACDPEVHRPLDVKRIYDVSFIGTFYLNRYRVLKALKVKPHIFGNFWYLKAGIMHKGVYGEEYIKTINMSKINLNIHHPVDIEADAVNMRVYEVAGTGNFILTEEMESVRKLFPPIETYRNVEELNEKINQYLNDEKSRNEIGNKLREICVNSHTYLHRANEILRIVE